MLCKVDGEQGGWGCALFKPWDRCSPFGSLCDAQEIGDEDGTMFAGNRLWVKLNAIKGSVPVAHGHEHPVFGPGLADEAGGQGAGHHE